MRTMTIIKCLLALATSAGVLYALLLYYGIAIVLGAFGVPITYGWTLPLPDGSTIAIRGTGETAYRGYSVWYEATYRSASDDGRSGAIGTWYGNIGLSPVAYAAGTRILLVPEPSRVFVRTARGVWTSLSIDQITEPPDTLVRADDRARIRSALPREPGGEFSRGEIRYVSPDGTLIADARTFSNHLLARLFLRLSDDGERFSLLRIQQVYGKTR
jgi:hypothetical protein